jgi:hypothetical protein
MAFALVTRPANGVRNLTIAAVVAWFLLALFGSLPGVFDSEARPPRADSMVQGGALGGVRVEGKPAWSN